MMKDWKARHLQAFRLMKENPIEIQDPECSCKVERGNCFLFQWESRIWAHYLKLKGSPIETDEVKFLSEGQECLELSFAKRAL